MRRIGWTKAFYERSIVIDFIGLNYHVNSSFLIHFCSINNVEIIKNPEKRPKENLLETTQAFLARKRLQVLPVIFITYQRAIYALPVLIRGIVNPPSEQQASASKANDYAKLFHLIPDLIKLTNHDLVYLTGKPEFPSFLDRNFCINFLSNSLNPTLDKFRIYTPSTLTRRNSISINPAVEPIRVPVLDSTFEEKPQLANSPSLGAISVASSDSAVSTESAFFTAISTANTLSAKKELEKKSNQLEMAKVEASNDNGKILLDKWKSVEESGCALDWYRNSFFIINLKNKNLAEKSKISLILSAINNVELKCKLIDEFSKVDEGEQTLDKFKTIFDLNTTQDLVTYRRYLKALKYSPDQNLHEFYQKIYRYVYKSMGLTPETDDASITKLSTQWFLEKLPKKIALAMQGTDFSEGTEAAAKAEKIRSFQNVFLAEAESEINQVTQKFEKTNVKNDNYSQKHNFAQKANFNQNQNFRQKQNNNQKFNQFNNQNIQCFSCGGYGHTNAECTIYPFVHQQNNGYQNQNFQNWNNYGNSNRGNNRFAQNNFQQNRQNFNSKECDFCLKPGHSYDSCFTLRSQIQRGITSPNWSPALLGSNNMHTDQIALPESNLATNQAYGSRGQNPIYFDQ